MNDNQLYVSPKQRLAGNVCAVVIAIAALVVLILSYCSVLPFDFYKISTGTLLLALGMIFLITAFIQGNSVSLWLSVVFIIPAIISLLCKNGYAKYSDLYPLYIAMPGLGCIVSMLISKQRKRLLKAASVFIFAALIFLFEVFDVLGIGWTLLILLVYIICLLAYVVIYLKKGESK